MKILFALLTATVLFACSDKKSGGADSGTGTDSSGSGNIDAPSSTADSSTDAPDMGATCSQCVTSMCSTALAACTADTACQCTYNCIIMGGAEGSCKQQCSLPGNDQPWADLSGCIDTSCGTSC